MPARPPVTLSAGLVVLGSLLAGCGGGGGDAPTTATAPAAGVPTTPTQRTPTAPALSDLLAQVPDAARARTRIAAADLARAAALRDTSPVYARAVRATLTTQDRRLVAAAGPAARGAVHVGGALVLVGPRVSGRTPDVVPVEDGRQVAAGTGRLVVGRATAELLAGRPRTPVVSRREIALAQLCAGDAVAELLLGPDQPGFGGDSAAAVAVGPRRGETTDPEVVVCSVPGNGVPFAGIDRPLARGLRAAGLRLRGSIEQTEDDATERVVLTAHVRASARALALLGDPAGLERVVLGR